MQMIKHSKSRTCKNQNMQNIKTCKTSKHAKTQIRKNLNMQRLKLKKPKHDSIKNYASINLKKTHESIKET